MRRGATAAFLSAVCVCTAVLLAGPALAESNPIRPPGAALGSTAIGKIVSLSGSVVIERPVVVTGAIKPQTDPTPIPVSVSSGDPPTSEQGKVGDPVFTGDLVRTGADGTVGIVFNDGTAFNVSTNARMTLNEFVYDPNGKSNSTLFSLSKGTFTFIAGKVAKTGAMKIDTPVATMGIRGTTPHVKISEDGTVEFSTLVEDYKNRSKEKRVMPVRQRQARTAPPPDVGPTDPGIKLEKRMDLNLNICRGC